MVIVLSTIVLLMEVALIALGNADEAETSRLNIRARRKAMSLSGYGKCGMCEQRTLLSDLSNVTASMKGALSIGTFKLQIDESVVIKNICPDCLKECTRGRAKTIFYCIQEVFLRFTRNVRKEYKGGGMTWDYY